MNVLKKCAKKPLDVHLMIVNPDNYIEKFAELGSSVLTVHAEACTHLHRTVQKIKSLKIKAGVAINPHTPISSLESIVNEIDLVCIMSVNPGFGGQSFIENTYQKIFIAGGGSVGLNVAKLLEETHNLRIIELDENRAKYLSEELNNTLVLQGNASDEDLLKEEGMENTDL